MARQDCISVVYHLACVFQLDGDLHLAPGFPVPPSHDCNGYHEFIDETLPPESPALYGLHPNAETEFLTKLSENLFKTVLEMQPRDAGGGGGGGASREDKVGLFMSKRKKMVHDSLWYISILYQQFW